MKSGKIFLRESKKYSFAFIMFFNFGLGIFFINNLLAQEREVDYKDQQPLKTNIVLQKDSPLRVTVNNVDNTNISFQKVNFTVQNISDKKIRAITILGNSKSSGKIVTTSFNNFFQPGEIVFKEIDIEREVIEESKNISISIDYVEFSDGSFWGSDTQRKSEDFAGERAGKLLAVSELKEIINNTNELKNFLGKEITEIEPKFNKQNQTEQWIKGFRGGYRNVISVIQRNKEKDSSEILKILNSIEDVINFRGENK